MAVPKRKTSPSKRNMRRSHHATIGGVDPPDGALVVEPSANDTRVEPDVPSEPVRLDHLAGVREDLCLPAEHARPGSFPRPTPS